MCPLLKTRVRLAMKTRADINKTCCRQGNKVCPLFTRCSYQRQAQGDKPEVWITAHDMLFHAQPAFGRPAAVIIDERMWHKGIRGIDDEEEWEVPLDSLIITEATGRIDTKSASGRLAHYRNRLGRALMKQDNNGGVERKHLDAALSHTPAVQPGSSNGSCYRSLGSIRACRRPRSPRWLAIST